jgi:hypothetical protein
MFFLTLLTILKLAHLIGLIMGFGGAILADATIFLRGVIRPVSAYTLHQAKALSHIVTLGLVILWTSGAGLIWVNLIDKPEYLTNQKLWAKIFIVAMLTINGVLVHKLVLPFLRRSIGSRLFESVNAKQIAGMTLLGSISLVSWVVPFVLGKASELNYVTPMANILIVYAICVAVAWLGMFTVMSSVQRIQAFVKRAAALTLMPNEIWEQMAPSPSAPVYGAVLPFTLSTKVAARF